MKRLTASVFLFVFAVIGGGCASSADAPKPPDGAHSAESRVVKSGFDDFEKELLSAVKSMKRSYETYTRLLENLKKKRKIPYTTIPRGMGKRVDVDFDGYLLALMGAVLAEAGYEMKLQKGLAVTDSPVVSRQYNKTRIIDILEDCADYGNYELDVDEKNRVVSVYALE